MNIKNLKKVVFLIKYNKPNKSFFFYLTLVILFLLLLLIGFYKNNVKVIQAIKIYEFGRNELDNPFGLAASVDGKYIYVSNNNSNNIMKYLLPEKYNEIPKLIKVIGKAGRGEGQFNKPSGLSIDKWNNLYVTDTNNNRIQKFDSNDNYIYATSNTMNDLEKPINIALSHHREAYVVNGSKNSICIFDGNNGKKLWPLANFKGLICGMTFNNMNNSLYVAVPYDLSIVRLNRNLDSVQKYDIKGWESIKDTYPMMTIDSKQRLYVTLPEDRKVVVYDINDDFNYLGEIVKDSKKQYLFNFPIGITIDSSDCLYVVENKSSIIVKIKPFFD